MLQKSNNEKINMQLTIDKLTAEIEALKKEEKKEKRIVRNKLFELYKPKQLAEFLDFIKENLTKTLCMFCNTHHKI